MVVGLFIQITREGDEVLFQTLHHRYAMVCWVEVAYVSDESVPLVEGALEVDD